MTTTEYELRPELGQMRLTGVDIPADREAAAFFFVDGTTRIRVDLEADSVTASYPRGTVRASVDTATIAATDWYDGALAITARWPEFDWTGAICAVLGPGMRLDPWSDAASRRRDDARHAERGFDPAVRRVGRRPGWD